MSGCLDSIPCNVHRKHGLRKEYNASAYLQEGFDADMSSRTDALTKAFRKMRKDRTRRANTTQQAHAPGLPIQSRNASRRGVTAAAPLIDAGPLPHLAANETPDATLQDSAVAPGPSSERQYLDHAIKWYKSRLSKREQIVGIALSQGIPGPFLNVAAFFGVAVAHSAGASPFAGAAVCWLAMLLPSLVQVVGLSPFWAQIRSSAVCARALPGLHAAGGGLILMSAFRLYHDFRCVFCSSITKFVPVLAGRCAALACSGDQLYLGSCALAQTAMDSPAERAACRGAERRGYLPSAFAGIFIVAFCLIDVYKRRRWHAILLGAALGIAASTIPRRPEFLMDARMD